MIGIQPSYAAGEKVKEIVVDHFYYVDFRQGFFHKEKAVGGGGDDYIRRLCLLVYTRRLLGLFLLRFTKRCLLEFCGTSGCLHPPEKKNVASSFFFVLALKILKVRAASRKSEKMFVLNFLW